MLVSGGACCRLLADPCPSCTLNTCTGLTPGGHPAQGMARVTCEHCVCAEAVLHGQAEMDEQGRGRIGTKLHTFSVSQHPTCIIAVTVLQVRPRQARLGPAASGMA